MAVKGLHPVLGIEKSKKCQLLLFRTVMEGREVAVSGGAFSPGAQGLSPQSVVQDQQCGHCGEPVRMQALRPHPTPLLKAQEMLYKTQGKLLTTERLSAASSRNSRITWALLKATVPGSHPRDPE